MAGPSEPQKKEGLRCECGKLLFEKDPEVGLGVRCGRDNCRKFHPLEEINLKAAESQKEEEKMSVEANYRYVEEMKKDIMQAFNSFRRCGHLSPAMSLYKVEYYFTRDGSDCETDWNADDRTILSRYFPNKEIARRLEKELPVKIIFSFRNPHSLLNETELILGI